jgi:CBS-domain-containing membrane protein
MLIDPSVSRTASLTAASESSPCSPPPKVVRENITVEEAARMMLNESIRSLPVVGADGRVVGIVTESDLTGVRPWLSLQALAQREASEEFRPPTTSQAVGTVRVSEVMSRPLVTASPTDPLPASSAG